MPYYIGDVITDKEDLTLQTPEGFSKRFKVNCFVNHQVIDVDVKNKRVLVEDLLSDKHFSYSYDKLILSPGSKPLLPENYHLSDRVFTLRTVEETLRIKEKINTLSPKTA